MADIIADFVTLEQKKALLRMQKCFSNFTKEEIDILTTLLKEEHFSAGDIIVNEGDFVDYVYLIVKGTAEVAHARLKEGKPHYEFIALLQPSEAIGLNETGFYSITGKRTATVIAKTDMTVLSFSVTAFHGFALAYHHVSVIMRKQAELFLRSNKD